MGGIGLLHYNRTEMMKNLCLRWDTTLAPWIAHMLSDNTCPLIIERFAQHVQGVEKKALRKKCVSPNHKPCAYGVSSAKEHMYTNVRFWRHAFFPSKRTISPSTTLIDLHHDIL